MAEVSEEAVFNGGQPTVAVGLDLVAKLDREAKAVARRLDRHSAGHLVDIYYRWQEHRMALGNQVRSLERAGEPTDVLAHFHTQAATLEKQLVAVLGEWAAGRAEGVWAQGQLGIGPVLSAGLSAHIDIRRAPTVGHIWRFAGLDPSLEWLGKERAAALVAEVVPPRGTVTWDHIVTLADRVKRRPETIARLARPRPKTDLQVDLDDEAAALNAGVGVDLVGTGPEDDGTVLTAPVTRANLIAALAKRPYNAFLKVLLWKVGDSFVKVSGRENAYYGQLYRQRKRQEVERNEARLFADQARATLAARNIQEKTTRACYEDGRLPPGRIDLRARRWTVKLFVAHWHEVAYRDHYGKPPPEPYPVAYLGHAHVIPPP